MKHFYLFIAFLCMANLSVAQKQDATVSSNYKKGEFLSTASIVIDAPEKVVHGVIDDFVNQYNNDLDKLFTWALKGLKLQGEADDYIVFNIKSHKYDKAENIVEGVMDMNILLLKRNFENVKYKTTTIQKLNTENEYVLEYQMTECEEVMEYVDAVIHATRIDDNKTKCSFDVKVRLEFPYKLMTMKQFEASLEWRFTRFLSNLRDEAERR